MECTPAWPPANSARIAAERDGEMRFCPSVMKLTATPTTSPAELTMGPPEEPCEIDADTCSRSRPSRSAGRNTDRD